MSTGSAPPALSTSRSTGRSATTIGRPAMAASAAARPKVSQIEGNANRSHRGVKIGDLLRLQRAEHMQPALDAESDRELVEGVVLGAGAGNDEMRLRQAGERADKHVLIFLLGDPADIEKERLRLRQAETPARCRAALLRLRRVEAMLDQDHAAAIARWIARIRRPGAGAVNDIGGIEPKRAGNNVQPTQQAAAFRRACRFGERRAAGNPKASR